MEEKIRPDNPNRKKVKVVEQEDGRGEKEEGKFCQIRRNVEKKKGPLDKSLQTSATAQGFGMEKT